ncbi:MAG: hypothetical protein HW390_1220 [Candidatus Brocadiaceae bacterium]|nr:hypothetical protein [Candidatus Brocadiaceae bacterium]
MTLKHKHTNVGGIFEDIRNLITAVRSMVVRNVNTLQVLTNFEIGRRIVEEEQKGSVRAKYGKQIITELSKHLTTEFGRGFSRSNLEYMRKFYQIYQSRVSGISQTASGKSEPYQNLQAINEKNGQPFLLSWSQYVFLIGIKDADARRFYEIEAVENNWIVLGFSFYLRGFVGAC